MQWRLFFYKAKQLGSRRENELLRLIKWVGMGLGIAKRGSKMLKVNY